MQLAERSKRSVRLEHATVPFRVDVLDVALNRAIVCFSTSFPSELDSSTSTNVEASYPQNHYLNPAESNYSISSSAAPSVNSTRPSAETTYPQNYNLDLKNPNLISNSIATSAAGSPEYYRTSDNTTDLEHGSPAHLDKIRNVVSSIDTNEVK